MAKEKKCLEEEREEEKYKMNEMLSMRLNSGRTSNPLRSRAV